MLCRPSTENKLFDDILTTTTSTVMKQVNEVHLPSNDEPEKYSELNACCVVIL